MTFKCPFQYIEEYGYIQNFAISDPELTYQLSGGYLHDSDHGANLNIAISPMRSTSDDSYVVKDLAQKTPTDLYIMYKCEPVEEEKDASGNFTTKDYMAIADYNALQVGKEYLMSVEWPKPNQQAQEMKTEDENKPVTYIGGSNVNPAINFDVRIDSKEAVEIQPYEPNKVIDERKKYWKINLTCIKPIHEIASPKTKLTDITIGLS